MEVKNSTIDDGTKVAHLTYIGDADVGKRVNFRLRNRCREL